GVVLSVLLRRTRRAISLATAFSIAVAIMALTRLVFVMGNAHDGRGMAVATLPPVANKEPRLPGLNVYYILLDAYAGHAGLKMGTGWGNAQFLSDVWPT